MMMRRGYVSSVMVCLLSMLLMVSCKPSVPGKYISPGDLEDILYDYHLADAEANTYENRDDTLRMRVYRAAILKKHGYTEEEFEESMVYYMRHSDRLHDVYEKLANRLSDEALALGASMSDINQYMGLNSTGDTANVWPGDQSFILMQNPAYSTYTFFINADSTYHKGDKFKLEFSAKYLFQDGSRDGIAMMAVKLGNDSVISRLIHVGSSSRYNIQLDDADKKGIKEVRGFFLLNRSLNSSNSESLTTLKLLAVNGIQLVRLHDTKPVTTEKPDTEDEENRKDSSKISTPISVETQRDEVVRPANIN